MCPFAVLICEYDIVNHLMSIVPCVQLLVERAVSQLGRVCVRVCERQARHAVRERVRVEGVCHVGVVVLHAVHCVEHAANQEAVAVATPPKACAEALYWLQVSVAEVEEQRYFLVEALRVHGGIQQPQARLIHSKLQLRNIQIAVTERV